MHYEFMINIYLVIAIGIFITIITSTSSTELLINLANILVVFITCIFPYLSYHPVQLLWQKICCDVRSLRLIYQQITLSRNEQNVISKKWCCSTPRFKKLLVLRTCYLFIQWWLGPINFDRPMTKLSPLVQCPPRNLSPNCAKLLSILLFHMSHWGGSSTSAINWKKTWKFTLPGNELAV